MAEICTSTGPALCLNTIAGEDGSCNECLNNKANRVCVSETQYSICNGGEVLTNLTYTCPPPQPYCKATVDGTTGSVTGICVDTDEVSELSSLFIVTSDPPLASYSL